MPFPAETGPMSEVGNATELKRRRARIALIPFAIALIAGAAFVLLSKFAPGHGVVVWVWAALFVILTVALPACLCVVVECLWTGEPPEIQMSLSPLFPSRAEREFRRSLAERLQLDDDAFYDAYYAYYAKSEIPRHVPVRLREMLQDAVGFEFGGLRPDDGLIVATDELDWSDIFYRMQREFAVPIPKEAWSEFDGTFDSLVKMVAKRITENRPPTLGNPLC
jgi:hypothetical protein